VSSYDWRTLTKCHRAIKLQLQTYEHFTNFASQCPVLLFRRPQLVSNPLFVSVCLYIYKMDQKVLLGWIVDCRDLHAWWPTHTWARLGPDNIDACRPILLKTSRCIISQIREKLESLPSAAGFFRNTSLVLHKKLTRDACCEPTKTLEAMKRYIRWLNNGCRLDRLISQRY